MIDKHRKVSRIIITCTVCMRTVPPQTTLHATNHFLYIPVDIGLRNNDDRLVCPYNYPIILIYIYICVCVCMYICMYKTWQEEKVKNDQKQHFATESRSTSQKDHPPSFLSEHSYRTEKRKQWKLVIDMAVRNTGHRRTIGGMPSGEADARFSIVVHHSIRSQ